MSQEDITRLENKLDGHIDRHDADYKNLLWWIIGTMISVLLVAGSGFITVGQEEQKISTLESQQKDNISRIELSGRIDLIDERFKNINNKLDDIKKGLNIK